MPSAHLTLIHHHQPDSVAAYLSGRLYYAHERLPTPTRPAALTHGALSVCLIVTPHGLGQGTPAAIAAYAYAISDALREHPGSRRRDLTLTPDDPSPALLTAQFLPSGLILPARHDVRHDAPLPGGHLIVTPHPLRAPDILSAAFT